MAEQVQRYRQYEYRANSNLVLTTDQHRPRTDEPSGEPESLKDFLDGTKFGDRVHFGKPDIARAGQKRKSNKNAASVKKARKEDDNVLALAEDLDSYRPRSKETRAAYEVTLSPTIQRVNTEGCTSQFDPTFGAGSAVNDRSESGRSATRHPARCGG